MKYLGARGYIALAAIVTAVLLIGSAILQRQVFRAGQETASLRISPADFRLLNGETVDLEVLSESSAPVFAVGFQADITFNRSQLEFVEAVPLNGWKTLRLEASSDRVSWVLTPLLSDPAVAPFLDTQSLGRLRFRAVGAGVATVGFDQSRTILAATDPATGNFVYNAAMSVQSSSGAITGATEEAVLFPETSPEALTGPETAHQPLFTSQKIIGTFAVPASSDVFVFITLAYPGRASIEFGPTARLGNKVESLAAGTHHVLQIAGLAPNSSYYYRVIGEQSGEQSVVVGPIRSVTSSPVSLNAPPSATRSDVVVFPSRSRSSTTVYVFPRDEAGATISGSEVVIEESSGVKIGQAQRQLDYTQFKLTRTVEEKINVTVRPRIGQVGLETGSAVLDPDYSEAARTAVSRELVLSWNHKAAATLLGGAIIVFLLGFVFIRLLRIR